MFHVFYCAVTRLFALQHHAIALLLHCYCKYRANVSFMSNKCYRSTLDTYRFSCTTYKFLACPTIRCEWGTAVGAKIGFLL